MESGVVKTAISDHYIVYSVRKYLGGIKHNHKHIHTRQLKNFKRAEWPSGLYSLRQVTEVKLGRVRSNSGWVTSEA